MKITALETWHTKIPFSQGSKPVELGAAVPPGQMHSFWLCVVTDSGLEGWGEGFGHSCVPATRTAFDTQIGPAVLGQDARDIRGLFRRLNQQFHIFGRNGPITYALSALDIALWDLAGKAANQPIWRLLGGNSPGTLEAYASLLRYGASEQVAEACSRAVTQGYKHIKLHEIFVPQITAARTAIGPDIKLMADVNCPWTVPQAIDMAQRLKHLNLTWLEEPVFPPEDHAGIARVRREGGIPISAGENTSNLHEFMAQFEKGALDNCQPSVIKVGGITAMIEIAALAKAYAVRMVPHCAYFGAGFLASLHVNTALAPDSPFERLFLDLEASPYHDAILAKGGRVNVPNGPGLGHDPDMDVLRRYALGEPTRMKI
ncbi:MAG: mandelate racemase/muconate lactonizing enzyme family protein [Acetobacteraceae bacterium]|nr:mandelate racemase/muconate lactonizing enzyme family protein [Acetobacteraceae bacterium]